ncbi:MAG: hypothetical protein ACRYGR_07345 [Janthinobacterium lividum]
MTTGFHRSHYLQNSTFFDFMSQGSVYILNPQNLTMTNQIEGFMNLVKTLVHFSKLPLFFKNKTESIDE